MDHEVRLILAPAGSGGSDTVPAGRGDAQYGLVYGPCVASVRKFTRAGEGGKGSEGVHESKIMQAIEREVSVVRADQPQVKSCRIATAGAFGAFQILLLLTPSLSLYLSLSLSRSLSLCGSLCE